ncbi:hypothetical protein DRW48_12200 [Paracoccus suum]|uniref:PepSY domain-containing protein n=1 Tax=Paracoccus suum TaxID=2259340 RepID=A0A344PLV0_9RHOB|nr:hypothetical protein [Paracoccus suum]AXC50355.1 hypothetical protein DRW48_12200 [Paracoccus suum]
MYRLVLIPAVAAVMLAGPAFAQTAPATDAPAAPPAASTEAAPSASTDKPTTEAPAEGKKLTEILSGIEGEPGFLRFDDIEWDSGDGTWNIEYLGTGGRKTTVEINGTTGEPVIE